MRPPGSCERFLIQGFFKQGKPYVTILLSSAPLHKGLTELSILLSVSFVILPVKSKWSATHILRTLSSGLLISVPSGGIQSC